MAEKFISLSLHITRTLLYKKAVICKFGLLRRKITINDALDAKK